MMEYDSSITELDLRLDDGVGIEAASFLVDALGRNALPHLARLLLCNNSSIGDDGEDGLVDFASALEQNETLTELTLTLSRLLLSKTRRWLNLTCVIAAISAGEVLPPLRTVFQIASAVPLLLEGLRENTSLVQVNITGCPFHVFPPVDTSRCGGGWMQAMQFLGYQNRVLPLVRAHVETPPPLGLWSHVLAKVATLADVLSYVLRAKPKLVPSVDAEEDTSKKRKRGDNE
jgi:hypothetical protein